MPARVVVVHDDPTFVQEVLAAISSQGHHAAAFADPLDALDALQAAKRVELLVTLMDFGPGKPHGLSLALMARSRREAVRTLFLGGPEHAGHADGVGEFMSASVTSTELAEVVNRLLGEAPAPS